MNVRSYRGRYREMRRRLKVARRVMRGHGVIFNVMISGHQMRLQQHDSQFDVHMAPSGQILFEQFGVINGPNAAIEIPNLSNAYHMHARGES